MQDPQATRPELDLPAIQEALNRLKAGDFTVQLAAHDGPTGEIAETLNDLAGSLNQFAAELTRVARELGTEGRFGCQMEVAGLDGSWKDMADHVNLMARNLTNQFRDIAQSTTAIANGNMSRKVTVGAEGEILELKGTMNIMGDQMSTLAQELTRIAREVGREGRFGGQAEVRGASGSWKDLLDNVNEMSRSVTDQVRDLSQTTNQALRNEGSRRLSAPASGETAEAFELVNTLIDERRATVGQ